MSEARVSIPLSTRLVGGRVVLRPPRASDIPEMRALLRDNADHLRPWSPQPPRGTNPLSLTELSSGVASQRRDWRRDRGYALLITLRAPGDPIIGRVTLNGLMRGVFQNAYVGYWIAASMQGRGLTTEALALIVPFAFERAGLHRLQAAVMPHNLASRRVLEKRLFREEGLAKRYLAIAGKWEDHVLYALTREEWSPG
jgi:ribosomal-protein-alanine N-acetyltransferase